MGLYYSADNKSAAAYGYGISPSYDLDEETGLPEVLDEGAYFKVSKGRGVWSGYHIISYMIPRWWWFDKKAVSREEISGLYALTTNDILTTALKLIEVRERTLKIKSDADYRRTYKADQKVKRKRSKIDRRNSARRYAESQREMQKCESRLLGKYPPKNLRDL